jgi:energy-coupling factor transporter ATP-binding protein EcfA2
VLNHCSTEVAKGEVVVVCGPSGSGKSTLIKCVKGVSGTQETALGAAGMFTSIMMDQGTSRASRAEFMPKQISRRILGREPINSERSADVRFGSHSGLKSDIATCPKSASSCASANDV